MIKNGTVAGQSRFLDYGICAVYGVRGLCGIRGARTAENLVWAFFKGFSEFVPFVESLHIRFLAFERAEKAFSGCFTEFVPFLAFWT